MSAKLSKISNASCWALACRLFGDEGPLLESVLSDAERGVLAALGEIRAVKPHQVDLRYVLCPYCQLQRGQVVQAAEGLACECLECGVVPVDEIDLRAWMFNHEWLIRKLRTGMNIPTQQAVVPITSSLWQIGAYQRRPVLLARSLDLVLRRPSLQGRARGKTTPWLIAPKPLRDVEDDPLAGAATWLPMEERFTLYGGAIRFTAPGAIADAVEEDASEAVNGPFSADFRWVHLAGESTPVALSPAQAAVFAALWHFAGVPQEAYSVMSRAGFGSDKPSEIFKLKTENKGNPKYEGPHRAYGLLVETTKNPGTYAMTCAAQNRS